MTEPTAPPDVIDAGWEAYGEADTHLVSDVEAAMHATYAAGVAAGRTAAATDIRAEIVAGAGYEHIRAMNAAYEHAARIAEGGEP